MASINDPQRLDALQRSGLLRHDVRERLNVICETAATMLRVPVVQLNVLDDLYQHTVGKYPPDWEALSIRIERSNCEQVLLNEAPVVVPNTLLDPIMCLRDFVVVAGMRAYLGVPMRSEGQIVGTLCCVDWKVRDWRPYEVTTMEGLAELATTALEAQ